MRALSLGEKVLSWFAADDTPPATDADKRPNADQAPPPAAPAPATIEGRLKELLAQSRLLSAGRVHMINLDTLRERLGDAWPELRERVHTVADRIIKRHLSSRDVHFQSGEGEYIVVFASLDKTAATLVCAKVAEELHRVFLGNPDLAEVKVSTAVGMLDGRMLYERTSVADLLRSIEQTAERPEQGRPGRGRPQHGRSGQGAGEARAATAAGADVPSVDQPDSPVEPSAADDGQARRLKLASQEFEQIHTMFRPIWDVKQQVISTYMCTPVRQFPDGSSVEGVAALAAISDPQRLAKINRDALIDTVEILDELFRNKFRFMVSVPICFETLAARRSRQDYVLLCQSIPDYLRSFLTFEFFRFPAGVPSGRMSELVNELRPFCRWTFLRVDIKQQSFTNLVGTGLTGVSAMVPADRGAEARTMEDLNSFAASAERANLRTCMVGITSTSLTVAARAAGVTYIAGDRIGRADEIPQHMLRFGWQDLFLRDGAR